MGTKAAVTNGPVTNGSKYRSRRLSAKTPSLWLQSGWLITNASRPAGPSSPASSKDWYPAANAAMRCRGRRPVPPRAKSITTAASAPTLGAISAGRGGAARAAEPTRRRQEALERELTRIRKSMERLLTAYQEDLLSLDELRRRMPELRAREESMRAERQAILDQAADQISFLRLAETLTAFLQRLRHSAETLEIAERQKVVRLLVKEVLFDNDTITIRHSIPAQTPTPPTSRAPLPSNGKLRIGAESYLLRSGSDG